MDIVGEVNLSGTTNFSEMFRGANKFNGDVSGWDVSGVVDMSGMFRNASGFNQDLNDWDVSGVVDMRSMFYLATAFNQDISEWDVGSVTDMMGMFEGAGSFNQDLSGWRVCGVTSNSSYDGLTNAWVDSNKPKWGAPCVKSVGSDNVDGTYEAGDVVNVMIEFSENVDVSGVPKLELEFDLGIKDATYVSGSGTTNLTFSYTIGEYDVVSDLDYQNTGSLKLNGGGIIASDDGVAVVLTLPKRDSLARVKDISVTGNSDAFVSNWDTSLGSPDNQVTLPLENGGNYDFLVYWGDGNVSKVTAWDSVNKTHTYGVSGNYTINIIGEVGRFQV